MEAGFTPTGARRRQSKTWKRITQTQSLCSYWLKRADSHVSSSFARHLKACGLVASEWAAIRQLYRPNRMSPVEIAQAIGIQSFPGSRTAVMLVGKPHRAPIGKQCGSAARVNENHIVCRAPSPLTDQRDQPSQAFARINRVEYQAFQPPG
jgi:hypothetical protein